VSAPDPECPGCRALRTEVQELQALVAQLQAQVQELTARLNQNSRNSGRPPSADPPHLRAQRPTPPPSGRKPGGQPGHKGRTRCSLPPDQVVVRVPEACAHCGAVLPAAARGDEPAPRVHQVVELPPVALQVTEYQLQARACPGCGHCTWGTLPADVAPRGEGPRLQAFCALLTGRHRLSRRQVRELLRDLCGWAPALGTLVALEAATSTALAVPVAQLAAAVAAAREANVDETSWREGKERPSLWTAVTTVGVLFRIGSRGSATFQALLPPSGERLVGSDRYVVYDGLPPEQRQICWAHLLRNFQALLDRGGPGALVGRWALAESAKLFALWHRFRRDELTRADLLTELVPIQDAFRTLLRLGETGACSKTAALCTHLLDRWEALWNFALREGVEPTNNVAERALRPAVLWRKGSFGHKSAAGREFVERMLTVVATSRMHGRAVLPFLTEACQATISGEPAPSLLPSSP
jgi:transposase